MARASQVHYRDTLEGLEYAFLCGAVCNEYPDSGYGGGYPQAGDGTHYCRYAGTLWLKPFLQIHDELVFEIPADKIGEAVAFVKQCMEVQPFPAFDVPIIAEAAYGVSFGEMKEME